VSDRQDSQGKPDIKLPDSGRIRWGARRKLAVILGIRSGIISREEAYSRYLLSAEELASWEESFDRHGIAGLTAKTTGVKYRERFLGARRRS
jgi:hypothetical protein